MSSSSPSKSWWWHVAGGAVAVGVVAWTAAEVVKAKRRSSKEPPGPLFFIPYLGETPEFARDLPGMMWRRFQRYGSNVFRSHVLGQSCYVIADAELCKGPLSDTSVAAAELPIATFNILFGNLYNRIGVRHKIFRKHQQAALLPQNLKSAFPDVKNIIRGHVARWLDVCSRSDEAVVRIDHEMRHMFVELAAGPIVSFNTEDVVDRDQLTGLVMKVQAGLFAAPIYLPGTAWFQAYNLKDKYFSVLSRLLEKRFPPERPGGPLRPEADTGAPPGMDLLKAMVMEHKEAGDPMHATALAQRMAQNIMAGTETTAAMLLAVLVATAARQDVQAKIREEQAALVARNGPEIEFNDLSTGMPYLDAVVRETMRLAPSAHGSFRKLLRDVEVDGYTLKKGRFVMLSFDLASAVDAIRWANAHAGGAGVLSAKDMPADFDTARWQVCFQPERWLGREFPRNLHLFGFGPHSCLGRDLAILEIKLITAFMARQCKWSMPKVPNPKFGFIPVTHVTNGAPELRLVPAPITA